MRMEINILFFAQARQIVGRDSMTVSVDDPCTIREIKSKLITIEPKLSDLVLRSSFAIDQTYADEDSKVSSGAEVAMIPPVSGG